MDTSIGRSRGTDYFRIADQLTGEELDYLRRTRLRVVPGGGHLFLLEQPADMATLVTRFLATRS